jgi:sulfotransferase
MNNIDKTYYFLSGLPRSGSTLLSAILNQNPNVYVTPTSPLLDQLVSNQDTWNRMVETKASGLPIQLDNLTRRLINAMYMHVPQNIIIDKNRGWGKNMPASTILFKKEIKMIATTRDLPSIMASWLVLLKKNPNSYMKNVLNEKGLEYNDENMMNEMYENMVKDCMEALQQAKKDASNRLLLIDYDEFVIDPKQKIIEIENFLNLPQHNYDLNNIQSLTNDDDLSAWGLSGMHTIRSNIKKISSDPKTVLGEELYNKFVEIEKEF